MSTKLSESLERELLAAAQDGQALSIASSMMAMSVTACELFLSSAEQPDGTIKAADQATGVNAGLLARAKCEQLGEVFARKLYTGSHVEERRALAEAVECLTLALVLGHLTARCVGGGPLAIRGAALMGADSIIKDMELDRKGATA